MPKLKLRSSNRPKLAVRVDPIEKEFNRLFDPEIMHMQDARRILSKIYNDITKDKHYPERQWITVGPNDLPPNKKATIVVCLGFDNNEVNYMTYQADVFVIDYLTYRYYLKKMVGHFIAKVSHFMLPGSPS
jgi:hypothetical protein